MLNDVIHEMCLVTVDLLAPCSVCASLFLIYKIIGHYKTGFTQ